MSVDTLQEKIRKTKNPGVLQLSLPASQLPEHILAEEDGIGAAYARFCRELMTCLKGKLPAVRLSFSSFALLGHDGLYQLSQTLKMAKELGYYVILDAPEMLSPETAALTAEMIFGPDSLYPCDGLVIGGYLGSDVIKPFLPYCKKEKKALFVVTRTANKSAPELQDLRAGARLVHMAGADYVSRYGAETIGRAGYTQVGLLAAASSAESLRNLRAKYPKIFLLVDGYDYPNANAKNCASAFDQFGHGAAVCDTGMATAWKQGENGGKDYLEQAQAAAERMKKNLTRYVTVL